MHYFPHYTYVLSVTVLTLWVAPPEMFCNGIGFNGAETNCGIAHILGILLMNSCNTDIFFSNYYHLQSVRFELVILLHVRYVHVLLLRLDSIKFICSLSNKWSSCTKLINTETTRLICITKLQLVSDFGEQQTELKQYRKTSARGKFKGTRHVASEFRARMYFASTFLPFDEISR